MEAAQGSSALQSAAGWTHKAFLFYEAVFPTLNSSPCFPTCSPHYSGPDILTHTEVPTSAACRRPLQSDTTSFPVSCELIGVIHSHTLIRISPGFLLSTCYCEDVLNSLCFSTGFSGSSSGYCRTSVRPPAPKHSKTLLNVCDEVIPHSHMSRLQS